MSPWCIHDDYGDEMKWFSRRKKKIEIPKSQILILVRFLDWVDVLTTTKNTFLVVVLVSTCYKYDLSERMCVTKNMTDNDDYYSDLTNIRMIGHDSSQKQAERQKKPLT